MKLITRQSRAAKAAEAWAAQYRNGRKKDIHDALLALGESPSPDDVNQVIGNGSWTDLKCDECGCSVERVVMVGEEPDYESSTAQLCPSCLSVAAGLASA